MSDLDRQSAGKLDDRSLRALLDEAASHPRPPEGTALECGAVLLGRGRSADVWGLGDQAIKLFRHRSGIDVPRLMAAEIATYSRIPTDGTVMPRLAAHGMVESDGADPSICGWAIYTRLPGVPLSFDRLRTLSAEERAQLVSSLVAQTITLDAWLNSGTPVSAWGHNYVDERIVRLHRWRNELRSVSDEDLSLASRIADFIRRERRVLRYIHGDFNPPNVLVNFADHGRTVVGFVDPMISLDAPESNWRHFTAIPGLADVILDEYAERTGTQGNRPLLHALGAFSHLYNAIAEPSQAAFRREALHHCLVHSGL